MDIAGRACSGKGVIACAQGSVMAARWWAIGDCLRRWFAGASRYVHALVTGR